MQAEYLSIGKVAKLKNISIKALRYYDEIGVFVPAYINPETNYRYYTKEQLPMLDAVNLCLKLGIPLKTLPAYIVNDAFDFAALLSDTQKLAEEKIQGIRLALDKIQSSSLSPIAVTTTNTSVSPATCVLQEDPRLNITYTRDEYLVALPISEEQLPPYDGYVLQLFIFARQRNLILENPSCILYRYERERWQKYLCLNLTLNDNLSPDAMASVFTDAGFALLKIPAGIYTKKMRTQSLDAPLDNSISVFGNIPAGFTPCLMERRIQDSNQNGEYNFELIHLYTLKCN